MSYKNYKSTVFTTGLIYNGQAIIENLYTSKKKQTKDSMITKIKRLQKISHDGNLNVDFEVAILTDEGWRSDKIFTVHEEPLIFDPENYNYDNAIEFNCDYRTFAIFLIPKLDVVGNNSDNKKNDCLYTAIRHILEDKMPEGFRSPKTFKKRIGVERLDGVDISKMSLVEELMKVNINVVGEHIFTSSNKYNKNINLKLSKGHYSINQQARTANSFKNSKAIIFYRIIKEEIHFVSLSNEWVEEYISMSSVTQKYSDHFLVNSQSNKYRTLKQDFDEFVKARDELLNVSEGFIDLYETPLMKSSAMHVFHHQARHLPKPEPISALEASWIDKAFSGGLIYSKKETSYEKAVCIDQNSQYAFNLSNKNFMFPIKAGKFSTITNDEITSYAPYGIFRCVISNDDKYNNLNKLFRFNKLNYYTHYDISNAIRLKFKVDLIQDGQANALLYDASTRVKGDHTFGKTVDYLFDLKQKVKYTKRIISALWGSLCQKNKYNAYASSTKKEELPENSKLISVHKTKDGVRGTYKKNDNIFKSNFARVGPFLTSYCRTKISETITKNFNADNIVRIHTDGFIVVNEDIPKELLSLEIGKFKIEHEGSCIINNTNSIIWKS